MSRRCGGFLGFVEEQVASKAMRVIRIAAGYGRARLAREVLRPGCPQRAARTGLTLTSRKRRNLS